MTLDQLNTELYQKMFAEQEKYKAWLLSLSPEEILNHAYEYTSREDILLSLEENDLTRAQATALLKSPSPLADVFKDWEKRETDHMADISETVKNRANTVIARDKFRPEKWMMDREQFITKTRLLIKDALNEGVRTWITFAEENVSLEQYVEYFELPKEEAISVWLGSIYAAFYFAKKEYGLDAAKKVVDLGSHNMCLYPYEIMTAARLMRDGATVDSICDGIEEGTLEQDENRFPSLEDVKRDRAKSEPER